MTEEELTRAVAQQMGDNIAAESEAELAKEKMRSFGQTVIDAATVGAFIAQIAQLAIQIHGLGKTKAELIDALQAKTASAVRIADDVRKQVIQRIVDLLTR